MPGFFPQRVSSPYDFDIKRSPHGCWTVRDRAGLTGGTFFTREDAVEETWRILQPLIDTPPETEPYQKDSWGPSSATELVRGHTSWQEPWMPGH